MIELTILGCGNMGRAFAEGLLRSGVVSSDSLHLVERRKERREALLAEIGCRCQETLSDLAATKYLLLAVKPQDLASAAAAIVPKLTPKIVVISLLAGVSMQVLQTALAGHQKIVRSMPNLPVVIGAGMSAFFCAETVNEEEREEIFQIFNAVGESLELSNENMLNAVTAISGSGPAYLYYFIHAWKNAALDLGFTLEESNILISQTLTGASWLWSDSRHDEESLRLRVSSKGGTTEAATAVLNDGNVSEIIRRAIRRSAERSVELEKLVKETL